MQPGLLSRAVDGKGVSLVYYFALPEGFELSHVENKAAVELLQRFVHDDVEQNGCATERMYICSCTVFWGRVSGHSLGGGAGRGRAIG